MTIGTAWNETVIKFTIVHYKAQMRMYTIQKVRKVFATMVNDLGTHVRGGIAG